MNDVSQIILETAPEPSQDGAAPLFFRHRKNGVVVFRMEDADRQHRCELTQIANIARDGEIVPHKRRAPTDAETAEISQWWSEWQARLAADATTETDRFVVAVNSFADWMSRRAGDEEVDAQSDALLMALFDLRQVVVRRIAKLPGSDPADDNPDQS